MSDIYTKHIRLTYKQRTWIIAYLQIDAPHDPDDLFYNLLADLLAQPMAHEPASGPTVHVMPNPEQGDNGRAKD